MRRAELPKRIEAVSIPALAFYKPPTCNGTSTKPEPRNTNFDVRPIVRTGPFGQEEIAIPNAVGTQNQDRAIAVLAKNVASLLALGAYIADQTIPKIIDGDFNMAPESLKDSDFPHAMGTAVFAAEGTCRAPPRGNNTTLDYLMRLR